MGPKVLIYALYADLAALRLNLRFPLPYEPVLGLVAWFIGLAKNIIIN